MLLVSFLMYIVEHGVRQLQKKFLAYSCSQCKPDSLTNLCVLLPDTTSETCTLFYWLLKINMFFFFCFYIFLQIKSNKWEHESMRRNHPAGAAAIPYKWLAFCWHKLLFCYQSFSFPCSLLLWLYLNMRDLC